MAARAEPPAYPDRTIEIVVSYSPGGSTDLVARAIAQKMQDRFGEPVVVLNKPGASGSIGATYAAHAATDGYTFFEAFTSEMVVVPELAKNAKYSIDDFDPIAVTGIVPVVLIGSKNIAANTLKDLIEELRQAPGKYTDGGGNGSPSHIMGAWLEPSLRTEDYAVPYRGGAQAVTDVIGGHIDMFYAGVAAAKAAIDSGTVKAFAVTGNARSAALPNVPTFKEAGVSILIWRAGMCCWRAGYCTGHRGAVEERDAVGAQRPESRVSPRRSRRRAERNAGRTGVPLR